MGQFREGFFGDAYKNGERKATVFASIAFKRVVVQVYMDGNTHA